MTVNKENGKTIAIIALGILVLAMGLVIWFGGDNYRRENRELNQVITDLNFSKDSVDKLIKALDKRIVRAEGKAIKIEHEVDSIRNENKRLATNLGVAKLDLKNYRVTVPSADPLADSLCDEVVAAYDSAFAAKEKETAALDSLNKVNLERIALEQKARANVELKVMMSEKQLASSQEINRNQAKTIRQMKNKQIAFGVVGGGLGAAFLGVLIYSLVPK